MEKEDVDGQQGGENKAVLEDPRWQGLYKICCELRYNLCSRRLAWILINSAFVRIFCGFVYVIV